MTAGLKRGNVDAGIWTFRAAVGPSYGRVSWPVSGNKFFAV